MRIPDSFNQPNSTSNGRDHRAAPRPMLASAFGGAPEIAEPGLIEAAWQIVRRRWPIILAATLLTAGLAFALSATREKQYTAVASLQVGTTSDQVLNNGGYVDQNRVAATYEELLKLDVIAQTTSRRLRGQASPREISKAIAVVTDPSSDVVTLEATTADPEKSAAIATEYSRAFIAFQKQRATAQIQEAIDAARRTQAAMTPEERQAPEGVALADRINQLESAKGTQTGGATHLQDASAPLLPSSPNPTRDAALGFVLGAILGFALAALLERADRAVKTVEELEVTSGWPVLARVPTSRALQRGTDLAHRSAEAEAYRLLRASLRYFSVNSEIRSLLVTSARSGEGKSTTARRLAEAMASLGDRVVLLEADMHRHAKAEAEQGSGERGLSGYLIGLELSDVLLEVPVGMPEENRTLTILPSGPLPPNPTELLESDRMHALMEQLEDDFDMVIVDSPPLPALSDAITLVGHVSGIIVVTAIGVTTIEDIRDVSRLMTLHGAAVLGSVANFAPGADRIKGYYGKNVYGTSVENAPSSTKLLRERHGVKAESSRV